MIASARSLWRRMHVFDSKRTRRTSGVDLGFPGDRDALPALVKWGFALAFGLLVLDAALSDSFLTSVTRGFIVNRQLTDIANQLEAVHDVLLDAETGQRAFLLSHRPEYLAPYATARARVDQALSDLARLEPQDPSTRAEVEALMRLARQRVAELDETIQMEQAGNMSGALALIRKSEQKSTMHDIRELIRRREAATDHAIREDDTAIMASLHKAQTANWLAATASFLVLAGFAALLRRHLVARAKAEAKLVDMNALLERDVRARTEELATLSRHLLRVQEEERASLARDLHDDLGGVLSALQIELAGIESCTAAGRLPRIDQIRRARDNAGAATAFARRTMNTLHPSVLTNLGLGVAMRSLVEEFGQRNRLRSSCSVEGSLEALRPAATIALFRIAQEALTNVAKHARATSVTVHLALSSERVQLTIADDGVGVPVATSGSPPSLGLISMRERVYELGGTFAIRRGVGGKGTVIDVTAPMQPPREH